MSWQVRFLDYILNSKEMYFKYNCKNMTQNKFEQSDWSLIFPSWEIISAEKRQKIITNSINTPIRLDESMIVDHYKNDILILISPTWSWKTTEYPQIVHENDSNARMQISIPLVWSTIWSSDYVAMLKFIKTWDPKYLLWNWIIGYRTWRWNSEEKRTQISFETYWISRLNLYLWNTRSKLLSDKADLHIFLDEIHELWSDFIFLLNGLKSLMKEFPWRIKLVLWSATIPDNFLDQLVKYLKKFPNFSLKDNLLDLDKSDKNKKEDSIQVLKIDWRTYPIELRENNWWDVIEHVVNFYKNWKSILCFQPWKTEINKVIAELQKILWKDIEIYAFHSEISQLELEKVLKQIDRQIIIVATNAAQTGVTLAINAVVSPWSKKVQEYDEFWNPVLVLSDITRDEKEQIDWRSWRKEKWYSDYIWKTKVSELKEQSPASIEIKVDEMDILKELADWRNILRDELSKKWNYLKKPNIQMLHISYEWLKNCGLMTKNEKITKLWFEVSKLPVSAFNWRIILEAIENWVADDIITMVSLIENKGFLKKEFDIKKFSKNLFSTDFSDFDLYKKLYEILSSTEIDDNILNVFINMWIDRWLINYFKSLNWTEKFYKVIWIDLETIWIKYKALDRTDETREKLEKYLLNNKKYLELIDKVTDNLKKRNLISKSLLSGNLHRIYSVIWKWKLQDYYHAHWDLVFEQWNTSYVNLNEGWTYIWNPFIIWWNWDKDDVNLMTFLTQIEVGDIEYFEKLEYNEYKIIKKDIKIKDYSIDTYWDTFEVPKEIINIKDKQKYLALNWLPYFLLRKNKFFINFVKNAWNNFNEDEFIKKLQEITLDFYNEIDPLNKDINTDKFKDDKIILSIISKSKDISDLLTWKKVNSVKIEKLDDKNSEFFDYVKLNNEYNKTLLEAKKYLNSNLIDVDLLENDLLEKFIDYLNINSPEDYSKLIMFIKNININKNNNWLKNKIKHDFIELAKKNKLLIDFKKRDSWLISFLNKLKKIKLWEEVSIKELSVWSITNRELLLSDPIIKRNNLLLRSTKLQKDLRNIIKFFNKIDLEENQSSKILKAIQRLLFSDTRKFNRWKTNFNKYISEFLVLKNNSLLEISELNKNKTSINAEDFNKKISQKNIFIKNIDLLINKLNNFKENILEIRSDISNIDFDDIIYNSDKNNSIYTKKFLYNVLINIIFEWNFIAIDDKQEEKLLKRLNDNLKWSENNINTLELIELIKNIISSDSVKLWLKSIKNSWIIKKNKSQNHKNHLNWFEIKLDTNISELERILELNKESNKEFEEHILNEFYDINNLLLHIKWILLEFYPSDILDLHENKILNFAKKISNCSIYNIDNEIKNLLISLPLNKSKISGNKFKELDIYKDFKDEILLLTEEKSLSDNADIDYIKETKLLENRINYIKEKTLEIKKILENIK